MRKEQTLTWLLELKSDAAGFWDDRCLHVNFTLDAFIIFRVLGWVPGTAICLSWGSILLLSFLNRGHLRIHLFSYTHLVLEVIFLSKDFPDD